MIQKKDILTELASLVDALIGLDKGEVGEGVQRDGRGVGENQAASTIKLQGVGVCRNARSHLYFQEA